MRSGLQGSEEITGRGREVTGSENFSFSPTVRSSHTHRHPRVSFSYSFGFDITSWIYVRTFDMPHSQYDLGPIHKNMTFHCIVASQRHKQCFRSQTSQDFSKHCFPWCIWTTETEILKYMNTICTLQQLFINNALEFARQEFEIDSQHWFVVVNGHRIVGIYMTNQLINHYTAIKRHVL